jgi:hypothetical protein
MATAAFNRFACEDTDLRGVAKDAIRQAGHVAHEVRAFKTKAIDAIEDGTAEAALRIRKEPIKFVGLAFAVGVPVGLALGWAVNHVVTRPHPDA